MLEYLPFEIITPITHLLDTKDYHTCLTINQLWYSVFIKFVSERVKISCTHHLETFLTLITRSSRSMRASKYIKYLDLHLMSTEDKDRYNTIIRSYLLNALIHCPNLETLSVISTDATIQTIMNPNMPRLTRLKYLKFSMVNHEYNLMGCYYKFRSSLTHLTLHTLAVSQRDYDEGTILSYLGSFPCLVSLDINLDQNLTIADVLKHCSTLTHLVCTCSSLSIVDISTHHYPLMEEIALHINDLYPQNISFIYSTFTHLKKLYLTIKHTIHNEWEVSNLLMAKTDLNSLKISVDNTFSKTSFIALWKYTNHLSEYPQKHMNNKASFYLNEFVNTPSYLSFFKCPITGITQISFMLHCSDYWGSQFEEYLKVIGHQLHHLVISDYNNPFIVDLEDINSLCPSLSTLCLKHLDLTNPCHSITPNFNLTSLVLDECNVVDSTFNDIEIAYPDIQQFKLSHCQCNP